MASNDSKTSTWRTRAGSTASFLGNVMMAALDPHYGLCSTCRTHAQRVDTIKDGVNYLYTVQDTAPDAQRWIITGAILANREEMAAKQAIIDTCGCRVGA